MGARAPGAVNVGTSPARLASVPRGQEPCLRPSPSGSRRPQQGHDQREAACLFQNPTPRVREPVLTGQRSWVLPVPVGNCLLGCLGDQQCRDLSSADQACLPTPAPQAGRGQSSRPQHRATHEKGPSLLHLHRVRGRRPSGSTGRPPAAGPGASRLGSGGWEGLWT